MWLTPKDNSHQHKRLHKERRTRRWVSSLSWSLSIAAFCGLGTIGYTLSTTQHLLANGPVTKGTTTVGQRTIVVDGSSGRASVSIPPSSSSTNPFPGSGGSNGFQSQTGGFGGPSVGFSQGVPSTLSSAS